MATPPPEKPQQHGPLHNFDLPVLKYNKNHSNNLHRGRRLGESSSSSQHQAAPSVNAAILRFQESLSLHPRPVNPRPRSQLPAVQHESVNVRSQLPDSEPKLSFIFKAGSSSQGAGSSSPSRKPDKVPLQPHSDRMVEKPRGEGKGSKTKTGLRVRIKKKAKEAVAREEDKPVVPPQEEDKLMAMAIEIEEEEMKSWNLRPRKPQRKPRSGNPGSSKVEGGPTTLQDDEAPPAHPPPAKSGGGVKKASPKKLMFSLTLTREEIEEDIFAMTGSKPSRKPKRRPKAVQKQLDTVFPGMWLGSVTPDSYKVPDASKKK